MLSCIVNNYLKVVSAQTRVKGPCDDVLQVMNDGLTPRWELLSRKWESESLAFNAVHLRIRRLG